MQPSGVLLQATAILAAMRAPADTGKVRELARALGGVAGDDVRMYLTGGATAVIEGWRDSTVDVDIRLEPERDELMRSLPRLKEELDLNVELASPPDFIPELPGWRERSPFILEEGRLAMHHFDPYSQALSKIERGFELDLTDVEAMIERGMVEPSSCSRRSSRPCIATRRSTRHRFGSAWIGRSPDSNEGPGIRRAH